MTYHYIYKLTDQKGKFYIGRHSTSSLEDKYMGSGLWPLYCKKKGKILEKTILKYYDTYPELITAEETIINENIANKLCMNFNNSSVGFATGDLHVSKNPLWRQKTSEHRKKYWTEEKRKEQSERLKKSNPAKSPETREKMSIAQKGKNKGEHSSFFGRKHTEEAKLKMREHALVANKGKNNPMFGRLHPSRGKIWIHKGTFRKIIHKDELSKFLIEGYSQGSGVVHTSTTRTSISNKIKGKINSEETKLKMSEAKKKYWEQKLS